MTKRAKEKLIRDWEYMETEARKITEGKGYCAISIRKHFYPISRPKWSYHTHWDGHDLGVNLSPLTAIKALRRAVEGK